MTNQVTSCWHRSYAEAQHRQVEYLAVVSGRLFDLRSNHIPDRLTNDPLGFRCGPAQRRRSQLHRRLTTVTGQTPTDFIRTVRLAEAAHLLAHRAGTVSEVAYGVGFNSIAHFSRAVRAAYGVPPSEYAAPAGLAKPVA